MTDLKPYVGRGIILGTTRDGAAFADYFVTGRSDPSRNRVFATAGSIVFTEPTSSAPDSLRDLRIYDALIWSPPIAGLQDGIIGASNGKQTHQVVGRWLFGGAQPLERSLNDWDFEPDKPNYTARINGRVVLPRNGGDYQFEMSIIKSQMDGEKPIAVREAFALEQRAGMGYLITTYSENAPEGQRIPPFVGSPIEVDLGTAGTTHDIAEVVRGLMGDAEFQVANAVLLFSPLTGRFAKPLISDLRAK